MQAADAAELLFPFRVSRRNNALWLATVAVFYFAVARFSELLAFEPSDITAICPTAGVFLSAILLTRRNLRPLLIGLLIAVDSGAGWMAGAAFGPGLIDALAMAGEAVLGVWLLDRFLRWQFAVQTTRDLFSWLILSVVGSSVMTGAFMGAVSRLMEGPDNFWSAWMQWTTADGVGNLLTTPFLLSWIAWNRDRTSPVIQHRVVEWVALVVSFTALSYALFNWWANLPLFALFLPYSILPFVCWAAWRFGVRGVATILVILAAMAVPFAASGGVTGFSYTSGVMDDVMIVQLLLAVTAVPGLLLATVISDRRQAEAALRAGEHRYRVLFEQAAVGVAQVDAATGRFVQVNQRYCDLVGYTHAEMLALNFQSITHPEDLTEDLGHMNALSVEKVRMFTMEKRYLRKDGTVVWVNLNVSSMWLPGQSNDFQIAVAEDITARKRAEEVLRRQAALLDAANDAIYVRSLDDTVTYWNGGAERLFGLTPAQAVGRKITDLGGSDHTAFNAANAQLLAHGTWSGELKKPGKDGAERIVFCRWTLLRDEQGQPKEVLAINTDVTEKNRLEAQFLRAQRMEGIGMLAGGIAHDLNNILTPIMMSTSLLRDAIRTTDLRAILDSVENSAQRGADIIRQLLTFARGQPGVRAPVPVRQLLREMEKLIRETFPRELRLTVTVPLELWPVIGDPTQMHQALMNLCVNARDAMPEGGALTLAAANITLDAAAAAQMPGTKPGPHVRLSVSDTGTGIPADQLDHIFDPFFTTKEIGQGTGLGLPTVLGVVRGHGGAVRVDSHVGQGTTIELFFPAAPETNPATAHEPEPLPPRGHRELILLVDDEPTVRSAARRALEMHGYRVVVAAEGTEALTLFAQHRAEIRAILTDMMMPGMNGTALVRALQQLGARQPILGMTGLADQATFKGFDTLGLPPLLTKPFSMQTLLTAVHQTLMAAPEAGTVN